MSDIITLEVKNRTELENLARSRGFDTIQAYLLALIEDDLSEPDEDYDLKSGLKEALKDMREGRTYPIESLWEMVETEDYDE